MRNIKKVFIILIVLIVVLIFAIAGVAYTYFYTDVFKTEKQKFFKYMSQNIENMSSLKSEELTEYYEKKKNKSYVNNGEFYTEVDEKTASKYMPNKKVYNEVKNFKIEFDGQKDSSNNYEHDTISLKYSNNEKMTVDFFRDDDYYGIKIDKVIKKYFGLENKNLKQFAENLGVQDTSNIPDKIEIKNYDKYKLSDEELKLIREKIYKILNENLQDTMFREESTDTYTKYILTLTNAKIEDVSSKVYQAIVYDEIIMSKCKDFAINELKMTEAEADEKIEEIKKEADSYIEKQKDELNQNDQEEKGADIVSINVYQTKGRVTSTEVVRKDNKISFSIDGSKLILKVDKGIEDGNTIVYNPQESITIEKKSANDTIEYDISIKDINYGELSGNIKYIGIQNAASVKESARLNSEIVYQDDEKFDISYVYNNNITFKENIEKEDFRSNSTKINNYNAEKMEATIQRLISSIDSLNKEQMETLGLKPNQNPFFYMTPFLAPLIAENGVIEKTQNAKSEQQISQLKETVQLEITSMKIDYMQYKIENSGYSDSFDEYINLQLSDSAKFSKLASEINGCGYLASYDKNTGIICTSKTDGSKIICKIVDGKDVWSE